MNHHFRLSRGRIVGDRPGRSPKNLWLLGLLLPAAALAQSSDGSNHPKGLGPGHALADTLHPSPGRTLRAPDPSTPAPSVDELVAEALRSNPSLQSQAHHVAGIRAAAGATGGPSSVMVGLGLQDVAFPRWSVGEEEMSMVGPELSVSFPWPGTGGARRRAVESEADGMAAELEKMRRELTRDVRAICARLYAIDREAASVREAIGLTSALESALRGRLAGGQEGQGEVLRALLARNRFEEQLDELAVERAGQLGELNRLLDRPAAAEIGVFATLPSVSFPTGAWDSTAVRRSADIEVRRAGLVTADRALAAARYDLKPAFTMGAGYGMRGQYDPVVNLKVGVELPFLGGLEKKPEERHARQRLDAAEDDLRHAEARARAEATRLAVAVGRNEAQNLRFRTEIIPASQAAFDAARAAWLTGSGDFRTVIEMLTMWLEAGAGLARREAERFELWAEVQNLIEPAPPAVGGDSR